MRKKTILHAIVAGCAAMACALPVCAQTWTWDGGGGNSNWSTGANWVGDVSPTNDGTALIIFDGNTQLTNSVDVNWDISNLTFAASAGAFFIGGNTLTIRSGIFQLDTDTQTVNNNITLGGSQAFWASNGNLVLGGNISMGANNLTFGARSNITVGGVISGSGTVTMTNLGTLFLNGANIYSGTSDFKRGGVVVSGSGRISNNAAINLGENNGPGGSLVISNGGWVVAGSPSFRQIGRAHV